MLSCIMQMITAGMHDLREVCRETGLRKEHAMDKARGKSSERRKKRNRVKMLALVTVLLIVGITAVCLYLWSKRQKEPYDSFETVWNGTLNRNAAIEYIPYSNGYMKVSRDGAEAVNSYGSLAWNISYDMNEPVAAVCREYAAVGDFGNRIVYMMDGTGSLYWKNVPYSIREVETSAVGVTAVRMNDGMTDYIQLITLAGDVLVEVMTLENRDGFPLDIALSEDGTKLVTSYLVLNDGSTEGWLTFYNFGEVGQNYANNLVGVFKYDDVIPQIDFMDNDTLCAFRKDGVDLYSVPELPQLTAELSCEEPILRAYTTEKYLAVMTDNTKNGTVARTVVYDKKAQVVFDRTVVEEFDDFLLSGDDIVFYNRSACLVMSLGGQLKFNSPLEGKDIVKIMPTGEKDKLMVLEEEAVSTIRLIHTKEE